MAHDLNEYNAPVIYFYFLCITGTYLITEIGVCGFYMVIQIFILNLYHVQGVPPLPRCFMIIGKPRKDIGTEQDQNRDDTKCNPDIGDHEDPPECSFTEVKHQDQLPSRRGESKSIQNSSIMLDLKSAKEARTRIARLCDKFCFVVFVIFHLLFIATVLGKVLKADG